MDNIDRRKICEYINNLLKDRCYVGLHSIVDLPTTTNEYIDLSKEEKAESILANGLLNSRGGTMNHTVRFFGDLSSASTNIKQKMSTYYDGINMSGKNYTVVIAIPYFFEDNNGQKICTGYKEYDENAQFRESAECVSDMVFSRKIPSEMILGYYSYDKYENAVVFKENPRYYSNLTPEEQHQFVEKYFSKYFKSLDVNNEENLQKMQDYVFRFSSSGIPLDGFVNTLKQLVELKLLNCTYSNNPDYQKKSKEEFLFKKVYQTHIQLQYPNSSIHNVECYRFACSKFQDGNVIYFIEYKDKNKENEEIDCYAILEKHNEVFYKSNLRIDYNILNSNVIREFDLSILPSSIKNVAFKDEQTESENDSMHLNSLTGANNGRIMKEPKLNIEEGEIVYIPVGVDYESENIITDTKKLSGFQIDGKLKSGKLSDAQLDYIIDKYDIDLDSIMLTGEYYYYEINRVSIPKEVEEYYKEKIQMSKGQKQLYFDELQELNINGKIYRFVKSLEMIDTNFEKLQLFTTRFSNRNFEQLFEDYLLFMPSVGLSIDKYGSDKFTGQTTKNKLFYTGEIAFNVSNIESLRQKLIEKFPKKENTKVNIDWNDERTYAAFKNMFESFGVSKK